jgi:hypothetical protein
MEVDGDAEGLNDSEVRASAGKSEVKKVIEGFLLTGHD